MAPPFLRMEFFNLHISLCKVKKLHCKWLRFIMDLLFHYRNRLFQKRAFGFRILADFVWKILAAKRFIRVAYFWRVQWNVQGIKAHKTAPNREMAKPLKKLQSRLKILPIIPCLRAQVPWLPVWTCMPGLTNRLQYHHFAGCLCLRASSSRYREDMNARYARAVVLPCTTALQY